MQRLLLAGMLASLLVLSGVCRAESPVIKPAKFDKAELKTVGQVPVLSLAGSPEEIGDDEAQLVADKAKTLLGFGPSLVKRLAGEAAWKGHVIISRALLNNVAERHQAEMEAFQKTSGLPRDELIASQMLYDTVSAFGCSSILVPAQQSTTGGPLMGRNFDYASFGLLHANDLVKIYRPEGKYAFASISFPGCFGVISGMNEHGLAIALHEVRRAADDSPKFNPSGVPTLLALRQVLEECRTIDEAKELLTKLPRTTMYNLAVCDPAGGAVLEVTVKNVIMRRSPGINACTNHFRADGLSVTKECDRFAELMQPESGKYSVEKVFSKLDAVKQGEKTFQSMVFEPKDLVLHVAIEQRPSTSGTLRRIDLKPLLK
jgi:hypothetical protein